MFGVKRGELEKVWFAEGDVGACLFKWCWAVAAVEEAGGREEEEG